MKLSEKKNNQSLRNSSLAEGLRAVMYVRSATYDEKIFEEQAASLQAYADRHGMQIVRRYVEGGFSGFKQGPKQKEMLNAVQAGTVDFSVILMRDISRWGRFQDCDECAYYEYLCMKAGIEVRYLWDEIKSARGKIDLAALTEGVKSVLKR